MTKITLPKNALHRVDMGKAFAEHDLLRKSPDLFVSTPATLAAMNKDNTSCFFVGRRGAGKTALTIEIERKFSNTITILPQIFDLVKLPLQATEFKDTRQKAFKSLKYTVERTLLAEVIKCWYKKRLFKTQSASHILMEELQSVEGTPFEERFLLLMKEIFDSLQSNEPTLWLRQLKVRDGLIEAMNDYGDDPKYRYLLLIDRLDESWDGSDTALICLRALMHASVALNGAVPCVKPYIFIRENIYDRIREMDNEFSRLETSVVFLDWTEEKLAELIAKRLVKPFTTKPKIVDAWGYFFEEDKPRNAIRKVMKLCQHRPRDILMFCDYAIKSAINENHQKITESDLNAEIRYSTSRLKDLGDEFAENFGNISVVIEHFYGLGNEFTMHAIENFIQKLMTQASVKTHCSDWFYMYSTPFQFIELLYNIGFLGLKDIKGNITYKGIGTDANNKPLIDYTTNFVIHPTYVSALNLRPVLIASLSDDVLLRNEGILEDIPDSFRLDEYKIELEKTLEELKGCPLGYVGAYKFEDIVGRIIKLCFFKSLTNVQAKQRTVEGAVIRDWIASNRAVSGFWEVVRSKHGATQIYWECKNYDELSATDFHQAQYYMNKTVGKFGVMAFRGTKMKDSYLRHIANIANRNDAGIVLVLTQNDLEVFLRQAIKGVHKEAHIQDRYDSIVRQIS